MRVEPSGSIKVFKFEAGVTKRTDRGINDGKYGAFRNHFQALKGHCHLVQTTCLFLWPRQIWRCRGGIASLACRGVDLAVHNSAVGPACEDDMHERVRIEQTTITSLILLLIWERGAAAPFHGLWLPAFEAFNPRIMPRMPHLYSTKTFEGSARIHHDPSSCRRLDSGKQGHRGKARQTKFTRAVVDPVILKTEP